MSTLATTNIKHASSASDNIVLDSSGNATLATAKITTLADSAGSNTSTPAEIASGRAKAWVNFNGTGTVAIRASYNVSSITDNGTGDYTVNFTTAMADANYAVAGAARAYDAAGTGNMRVVSINSASGALASSGVRINTSYANGSNEDIVAVCAAIFR